MFKDILIKGIKQIYEVKRNDVGRKSEKYIKDYFSSIADQLEEEIEVSGGEVAFRLDDAYPFQMELNDKTLIIDTEGDGTGNEFHVSVKHLDEDNYLEVIDILKLNGDVFLSENFGGKQLGDELMDIYLDSAFKREMMGLLNYG